MTSLRASFAVCLALVLILTSGAMAVARGQMAAEPGMTVVICHGTTTQTVRLGADGTPTAPPHACPDCILLGFAALLTPAPTPTDADTHGRIHQDPASAPIWHSAPQQGGAPRGPPLLS